MALDLKIQYSKDDTNKLTKKAKGKGIQSKYKSLKRILTEAKKITLDDLDFDTILKEQSNILCDIQKIIHNETSGSDKKEFKCSIVNLQNDYKFKKLLLDYTKEQNIDNTYHSLDTDSNIKSNKKQDIQDIQDIQDVETNSSITNVLKPNITQKKQATSIIKRVKQPNKKAIRNVINKVIKKPTKQITKKASRLSSNKKYNKQNIDITITKPNIYIKDMPSIKNMYILKNKSN